MIDTGSAESTLRWIRLGLLAIAAAGIIGTAIELATIRHWGSLSQLIPWVSLAVLAAAVVAMAAIPTTRTVRAVQAIAVLAMGAGAFGVYEHISENLKAGPLDEVYGATWSTMSTTSRWWTAASGGVGPSPLLAPAVLLQISLCLLLATFAHPARRAGSTDDGPAPR